jgi:hypothetical protein
MIRIFKNLTYGQFYAILRIVFTKQLILHNPLHGCPWTIPKTIHTYITSKFNYLIFFLIIISFPTNFPNNYLTPFPWAPTWI